MRTSSENESFNLSSEEIDRCAAWLEERLALLHVERKNALRARLLMEELLLRMQEQFDPQTAVVIFLDSHFGHPQIRLELPGEPFNPLSKTAEAFGDWNSSLMTAVGLHPKYSYTFGKNTLRLNLPNRRKNAGMKILLAVAAGLLLGFVGLLVLPQAVRQSAATAVLEPAFDLWSRTLIAISGPIVFFMAVTTILNTKGITRQGGSSLHVVGRFFLFSFLITAFAFLCARPVFSFARPDADAMQSFFAQGKTFLMDLIPRNIVEPFLDADTMQLFVLALICGGALVALGDSVPILRDAARQVNMIGLLVAKWVSLLVPFAVGFFLCLLIWSREAQTMIGMWVPLALAFGVSVPVLFAAAACLSVRMKVPFSLLVKKLKTPFLLTLRTGELDDNAFEAAQQTSVQQLGMDRNYIRFCLPQGLVLYMPFSALGALIFTMYCMQLYQVPVDLFRQVAVALLAILLFVITPPVPGQNLLSYAVIFSWIGIPNAAIIDAMFFEIIFGVFSAAANLTILLIETVFQAKRLGMLDRTRLLADRTAKKR